MSRSAAAAVCLTAASGSVANLDGYALATNAGIDLRSELLEAGCRRGPLDMSKCAACRGCHRCNSLKSPGDVKARPSGHFCVRVASIGQTAASPQQLDGGVYLRAARNGDLAMLRCLHRLGCPWGPPGGKLLADCIRNVVSVAVLQCLLDLGCPEMDWDAAVKLMENRVQRKPREHHVALLAWLGEQRRRSPGPQGA
ncbi:hypothetical protein PLESTM_002098300 [Pleodorina starrii]|nr:hypothetical protein PLESTM_002098300 [Pleodorina starrii]